MEFTIGNIRKFVKKHPNNGIVPAWNDMLCDMDRFSEDYTESDFIEEAEEQYSNQDLSVKSAASLIEYFPHTFSFEG